MRKIRFAVIGSGWRSKFYLRIAKALPEMFEVSAVLFRNDDKANKFREEFGIDAVFSKDELLKSCPDFTVIAVDKQSKFALMTEYAFEGMPVLVETPAGLTVDELASLWRLSRESPAKIQIAEQYLFYPSYEALIREAEKGRIGIRQSVGISCAHDYHAACLIRKALGLHNEHFGVFGKSYSFMITETDSRNGVITDGRSAGKERSRLTIEFDNGMNAFYDFSGVQYHSRIRSRHISIQGTRGEIDDLTLRYLNEKNIPVKEDIVYEAHFLLTEDEAAVSRCMSGMKKYIDTGKEFYPLSDALQDAYISILMHDAVKKSIVIKSEPQVWQ